MPTPTVLPLAMGTSGLSAALDITVVSAVVAVIMPDDWSPATVTLQGSADGTTFFNIYDGIVGAELVFNVKPRTLVAVNPNRLRGCKAIKLRSGTHDAQVPQAAPRTFGVIVEAAAGKVGGTKPATGYLGTKLYWADGT